MTDVVVRESPGRGRGVFANRDFSTGEIIEICPVIVLPDHDIPKIDQTVLAQYYFGWSGPEGSAALGLGFALLYNHSETPNAACHKDLTERTIFFIALRDIRNGEEIFYRYNTGPAGDPVWFEVR